jgi:hypothetical protein
MPADLAGKDLHQGGLPGAVLPEQCLDLPTVTTTLRTASTPP